MAIPGNFLSATTESIDPNTSGWLAHLNCTIALGSGGRNGDGVLRLTSVASGEMRARTAASYEVTPGETYWTFSDAFGATVPERIGIRWLDAANAEINITWSLTTATAGALWHRISVGGTAPAGAVRAQLLVSSTPAGAGVLSYFENVYFGWPLRTAGNLLSFNAESGGEIDLTAWAAESNCVLSRIAPMSVWPVDWYYSGGQVVALTVTALGNASALCVERAPVTEGVDYQAYAYLSPPTTGSDTWVELRYYDATDTLVSAHRGYLDAFDTGFQRQRASAIAPAGAATASIAIGIDGATAGQVVRSEGAVVRATDIVVSGSVVPYEDASFESGVGAWAVTSGVATIARSSPWGAQALEGSYSLTVASSTATSSTLLAAKYPVSELVNWRLEIRGKWIAGGWSITLAVDWYDATDTLISSSSSGATALPSDGQWWRIFDDYATPAGAVTGQIRLGVAATAPSSTMQLDKIALRQVLPVTEVTADDDTASIEIIMRELDSGDDLTLWRVTPDGVRTLVRGPDGLLERVTVDGDQMVIEDYEAPLGVTVYYSMEMTGPDGLSSQAFRNSDPVVIAAGDRNYAWLKDPSRPQVNMRVLVKSAPAWQQPIRQARYDVRGRAAPVIHSDVRSSREGDLVAWTESDEQREALRFLLSTGNVLLWQSAPGMGETDVYVSVAEIAFPRITDYAPEPWREWTLPMTEVDMPTGGVAGSATWTVHDVVVEYATGYDVLAAYATVFDLTINNRR